MAAASVPSTVGVPFLSENKKKELTKKIIDARNEWLQTASNICVQQVAEEVGAGAAFTSDCLMFCLPLVLHVLRPLVLLPTLRQRRLLRCLLALLWALLWGLPWLQ